MRHVLIALSPLALCATAYASWGSPGGTGVSVPAPSTAVLVLLQAALVGYAILRRRP